MIWQRCPNRTTDGAKALPTLLPAKCAYWLLADDCLNTGSRDQVPDLGGNPASLARLCRQLRRGLRAALDPRRLRELAQEQGMQNGRQLGRRYRVVNRDMTAPFARGRIRPSHDQACGR
jgi:hypothetical protein